jgi:hypothetical protein
MPWKRCCVRDHETDAERKLRLSWLPLGYLTEPELVGRLLKYHQDLIGVTKMNVPRSQVIFKLLRIGLEREGH